MRHIPRSDILGAVKQTTLRWKNQDFDYASVLTEKVKPYFTTGFGALYSDDCMKILPLVRDEVVDTVFADPPFNLGKEYGKSTNDDVPDAEYLDWCKDWLAHCVRVVKPGGAVFVYNLPKWNVILGAHLTDLGMLFRHWIAVEISACLPIVGKLHPSHYSLLYYTKGKPKTFRRIRTPILKCRHCGGEVKDYGGHRGAMNPNGVTLKDVWTDIPPVRHRKYKSDARKANALSTKMLDRVIEMSTVPGELVMDPFGGSGTTFAVCEAKHRYWLGMEIDYAKQIATRLSSDEILNHQNGDYIEA